MKHYSFYVKREIKYHDRLLKGDVSDGELYRVAMNQTMANHKEKIASSLFSGFGLLGSSALGAMGLQGYSAIQNQQQQAALAQSRFRDNGLRSGYGQQRLTIQRRITNAR